MGVGSLERFLSTIFAISLNIMSTFYRSQSIPLQTLFFKQPEEIKAFNISNSIVKEPEWREWGDVMGKWVDGGEKKIELICNDALEAASKKSLKALGNSIFCRRLSIFNQISSRVHGFMTMFVAFWYLWDERTDGNWISLTHHRKLNSYLCVDAKKFAFIDLLHLVSVIINLLCNH